MREQSNTILKSSFRFVNLSIESSIFKFIKSFEIQISYSHALIKDCYFSFGYVLGYIYISHPFKNKFLEIDNSYFEFKNSSLSGLAIGELDYNFFTSEYSSIFFQNLLVEDLTIKEVE